MLGLPTLTEMSKHLPKKTIYQNFNMNTAAKEKFDVDIKKITIVNEVSPTTTNIAKGETIGSFFVLLVALKEKTFDEKNIIFISKLISQNMIFILENDGVACLAVYYKKLLHTEWKSINELSVQLNGLNFDKVWENIIVQVGSIEIQQGNTLDEQLQVDETRAKLLKQIERLEKQVRTEKQPKKKFELVQEVKKLKKELEDLR